MRNFLDKIPKWLQLIFSICALITLLWSGGKMVWATTQKFSDLQQQSGVVIIKDSLQDYTIAQLIILQSDRNDSLIRRINNLEKIMCVNMPIEQLRLVSVQC